MNEQPPPGQGPIDPRAAFQPPPPPGGPQQQFRPPPPPPPGYFPPPPPGFYPPPMMMPPPHREKSFARAIFMTLATTIFGFSLLANLYLFMIVASTRASNSTEDTIVEGDPAQKVAIIPLSGMIHSESANRFEALLKSVEKDSNFKAIVVEVDTGGGTVTGSDEIYDQLVRFKKSHPGVPIVISMASVAASGGYYVSCAGDQIFAQPTTITGSIGVVLPSFNVSKMLDKWGVSESSIVSTGADFKEAGSMFRPENPVERQYFQALADNMFTRFKSIVTSGREKKLTKPIEAIANGKIYTGEEAKDLGLVDQIGYLEDAYTYAAGQAKLSKMTVVRVKEKQSLLGLFSAATNARPPSASTNVTVNGMNVNLDSNLIGEFLSPRPLYLWRGN